MAISLKEVPIKAYNSIRKVKRYHASLRRAYEILCTEDPSASPEALLQMAVKAINDTVGPDRVVYTFLIFSTYSWVAEDSILAPMLRQYASAIQKATEAICKLYAVRQVSETLAACNSLITLNTT
jgi:hypothetical protein